MARIPTNDDLWKGEFDVTNDAPASIIGDDEVPTAYIVGRFKTIFEVDLRTGQNVLLAPTFCYLWGTARISDPDRSDLYAVGTYEIQTPSLQSRARQNRPVFVREFKTSEQCWMSRIVDTMKAGYIRNVIGLRTVREDDDLFLSSDDEGYVRFWTASGDQLTKSRRRLLPVACDQRSKQPCVALSVPGLTEAGKDVMNAEPISTFFSGGSVIGAALHEGTNRLVLSRMCSGRPSPLLVIDAARAAEMGGAASSGEDTVLRELVGQQYESKFIETGMPHACHPWTSSSMCNTVLSTSLDNHLHVWDLVSGKRVATARTREKCQIHLHVPSRNLFLAGGSKDIQVFDVRKWESSISSLRNLCSFSGRGSDLMRSIHDTGINGEQFLTGSQNHIACVWSFSDDMQSVKYLWKRRMPASVFGTLVRHKGRNGLTWTSRIDQDEFERVTFWAGLAESRGFGARVALVGRDALSFMLCFLGEGI